MFFILENKVMRVSHGNGRARTDAAGMGAMWYNSLAALLLNGVEAFLFFDRSILLPIQPGVIAENGLLKTALLFNMILNDFSNQGRSEIELRIAYLNGLVLLLI